METLAPAPHGWLMHELTLSAVILLALAPVAAAAPAVTLHTYAAPESGIFANAYVHETPRAAIVVDATLTVSDGKKLRAVVDGLGKPLAAVFITHGHPDHYNCLTELSPDGRRSPCTRPPASTTSSASGTRRRRRSGSRCSRTSGRRGAPSRITASATARR